MEVVITAGGPSEDASDGPGFISVYHLATEQHIQTFKSTTCSRSALALLPPLSRTQSLHAGGEGSLVLAAQAGKPLLHVYRWGKEAVEARHVLPEDLLCIALSPDGVHLAAGTPSGKLYVWGVRSGALLVVSAAHYGPVRTVAWSSDGQVLASGSDDTTCKVWRVSGLFGDEDTAAGVPAKPTYDLNHHTHPLTQIAIGHGPSQSARLYTASTDGTIRIYNLATGEPLTTLSLPAGQPVTAILVDSLERSLYAATSNGHIYSVPFFTGDDRGLMTAIGGRGEIVGVGGIGEAVDDTADDLVLRGHTAAVTALAASLDGSRLVSGDATGAIFVWDAASRQVIRKLKSQSGPVSSIIVTLFSNPTTTTGQGKSSGDTQSYLPQLKRTLFRPANDLISVQASLQDDDDLEVDFDDGCITDRHPPSRAIAAQAELDDWNAPVQAPVNRAKAGGADKNESAGAEDTAGEDVAAAAAAAKLADAQAQLAALQQKYDALEREYVSSKF
ncbi:Pre-rRNA-processing protein ipi3 [Savitreella phatthalungensis]